MKKSKSKLSPLAPFIEIKHRAKLEDLTVNQRPPETPKNTKTQVFEKKIEKVTGLLDFNPEKGFDRRAIAELDKVRGLLKSESQRKRVQWVATKNTRDVSHLKDKIKIPELDLDTILNSMELPTELDQVKTLLTNSDYRGITSSFSPTGLSSPISCKREACVNRALATIPSSSSSKRLNLAALVEENSDIEENTLRPLSPYETFERFYLGNPTGRQEIENLRKWFSLMKSKYLANGDLDATEIIYGMCGKELVRQVTVHCINRGELLREVLEKQPEITERRCESLVEEMKKLKEKHTKEIFDLKNAHSNEIAQMNLKIQAIEDQRDQERLAKVKSDDNLLAYKARIKNLERHLEFKARMDRPIIKASLKTRTNTLPIMEHKLSVVYWKEQPPETVETQQSESEEEKEILQTEENEEQKDQIISASKTILDESQDKTFKNESEENEKFQEMPEDVKEEEIVQMASIQTYERETQTETIKIDVKSKSIESKEVQTEPFVYSEEKINAEEEYIEIKDENEFKDEDIIDEAEISMLDDYANIFDPGKEIKETKETKEIFIAPLPIAATKGSARYEKSSVPLHPILERPNSSPVAIKKRNSINKKFKQAKTSRRTSQANKDKFQIKNETPEPLKFSNGKNKEFSFIRQDSNNTIIDHKKDELDTINKEIENKLKILEKLTAKIESFENSINCVSPFLTPGPDEQRLNSSQSNSRPDTSLSFPIPNYPNISINITEYIPKDADINSWKAGFSSGFETGKEFGFKDGKMLGYEEGHQNGYLTAVKENIESNNSFWVDDKLTKSFVLEPEDKIFTESRTHSSQAASRKKKNTNKDLTKFMEFNFHHETTSTKKNHPAPGILQRFLQKDVNWISTKATISRKMLYHLMFTMYQDIRSKLSRSEEIDSLLEETYDIFITKYGLKSIGDKKFLEFVASLIKNSSGRRAMIYLRFLGCGEKLGSKNYSWHSFIFFLNILGMVMNSKIGIIFGIDDSADRLMYPSIRVIESAKEIFDKILDKTTIGNIVAELEKEVITDPKNLNPNGLIDLDRAFEILIENYENYQRNIIEGVFTIQSAMGFQDDECILKSELFMIIRCISPEKIILDENRIGFSFVMQKWLDGQQLLNLDSLSQLFTSDIISICIEKNVLSIADVKNFINKQGINENDTIKDYKSQNQELLDILNQMKSKAEKNWNYDENSLEMRLNSIQHRIEIEEPINPLICWKILQLELRRIKRECMI
ncbi:unnamed protein product [Blepharisma stoltei]|uniref:FH2 domain-containing protein n=1 Tax=Blepharisma stoltei TaxID=1481888 RepID=A0AAU9J568_9CILI|nr:unnamed protein product [Blepharisma stoltei]